MKIDNKNPIYKIDSCFEKINHNKYSICNRPSYHTVCNRPIVDRKLLTRRDYLNMLSTPRGFKWTGMKSYYKKMNKHIKNKQSNKNNDPWNR